MYILETCGVFLVVSIITVYLHITRHFSFWKKRNILYVKPYPIFGNIFRVFTFRYTIGKCLSDIYNTYKTDYIGFFVFDQPFLMVRDPELIKRILIKDFEYFNNRSICGSRHDKLSANIPLAVEYQNWKFSRPKLSPTFSGVKLKRMLPHIIEAADELKLYVEDVAVNSTSTECCEMCMKYTTDVISTCGFGINAHSFQDENSPFRVAARRLFGWSTFRAASIASYFFAPILVKLFKLCFVEPVAGAFLADVYCKHMDEREKNKTARGDLIDSLVELRRENDKNHLSEHELLGQAIGMFMAGYETSGLTLSYVLYYLAKFSKIQYRLRIEIKDALKKHGAITYEALCDMHYADMIYSETLRMFPVLAFLDRRCTKNYKIPGTDTVIPKGIPVYISVLGLHYDPQYYPNPHDFDPERFSEVNKLNIRSGTYLPFGDGPRMCTGMKFSQMSVKVALVKILTEYEVETCKLTPETLRFEPKSFLLSPIGGRLELHFKKLQEI